MIPVEGVGSKSYVLHQEQLEVRLCWSLVPNIIKGVTGLVVCNIPRVQQLNDVPFNPANSGVGFRDVVISKTTRST